MKSSPVWAVFLCGLALACSGLRQGASVSENTLHAKISGPHVDASYKNRSVEEDVSRNVDLSAGVESEDFYIVQTKYKFLMAFLQGVESPEVESMRTGLERRYGEAMLGDPIAIARVTEYFHYVTTELYPAYDPRAQYNLGQVYTDLRSPDLARHWFSKSLAQGFEPARSHLPELETTQVE